MLEYAHHVAHWEAHKAGAIGPLGWVKDRWGGYYQVLTIDGIYTFSLK